MNKKNFFRTLLPFFFLTLFVATSCSNEEVIDETAHSVATTNLAFAVKMPKGVMMGSSAASTRYDSGNYNHVGDYEGVDMTSRIDLYLVSADGKSLLESRRFDYTELTWLYDENGMQVVQPKDPILTTAGDKIAIVTVNSPYPLMNYAPSATDLVSITSEFPLTAIGQFVDYEEQRVLRVMMSGCSEVTTIVDGVTSDEVKTGVNRIQLSVDRMPSRVIVTQSPDLIANSSDLGTFSDITYGSAQGAKSMYLLPHIEDGVYKTYGYDYVAGDDYLRTSAGYYCYEYLQDINRAVPVNPSTASDPQAYLGIEGLLFLENTHANYQKGNTTYVMIRAKFTPKAEAIKDGGALAADGTFYVGGTDGNIYSSMAAAVDPATGVSGQNVATYVGGKTLYYVWLNPDNVQSPTVSPVIRNNIYHININSFKQLGVNWNPLTPDVNNPDPQPEGGNEPDNPIKPEDPLSSVETYMSVDIEVKNWTVHSYDVDL
ncbi:MAG: Mfa1 family fimbria major subunit [Prevotellaceae bacterium]|jgi:hypothetical protein|nr:Mfa1 family fimbria major subunit [Prevotellaceae bacterium]